MMESENLDYATIARLSETSESTVRRGIKAAEIPSKLLELIYDVSMISSTQWTALHKLAHTELQKKKIELDTFIDNLASNEEFAKIKSSDSPLAKKQSELISFLASPVAFNESKRPTANRNKAKKLCDHGRAYVKTNNNLKAYSLSFGQIPAELAEKLNESSKELMEQWFAQNGSSEK
jgi:hypothetical protein